MRRAIAEIVGDTLAQLPLRYPQPSAKEQAALEQAREELQAELKK
jgi:hypothetical protein